MKAVQKIFNFFSSSSNKKASLNQIKEQQITGELYRKTSGNNLEQLSKEVTLSFSQENPSSFDYTLNILNVGRKTDGKLNLYVIS